VTAWIGGQSNAVATLRPVGLRPKALIRPLRPGYAGPLLRNVLKLVRALSAERP